MPPIPYHCYPNGIPDTVCIAKSVWKRYFAKTPPMPATDGLSLKGPFPVKNRKMYHLWFVFCLRIFATRVLHDIANFEADSRRESNDVIRMTSDSHLYV